jgi:hypothetical protein
MFELAIATQVWNADAVTAEACSSAEGRQSILAAQSPSLRQEMELQARALAEAGSVPNAAAYLDSQIARDCQSAGFEIDVTPLEPESIIILDGPITSINLEDATYQLSGEASCRTGSGGGEASFCRRNEVIARAFPLTQICSWRVGSQTVEPGTGYRITPVWEDNGSSTFGPFTALRLEMHAEGNHRTRRRVSISNLSVRYVALRLTPEERREMGCLVPERSGPQPPLTTASVNAMNSRTPPPQPVPRQSAPQTSAIERVEHQLIRSGNSAYIAFRNTGTVPVTRNYILYFRGPDGTEREADRGTITIAAGQPGSTDGVHRWAPGSWRYQVY